MKNSFDSIQQIQKKGELKGLYPILSASLPLLFFLLHAVNEYKELVLTCDLLIISLGYFLLIMVIFISSKKLFKNSSVKSSTLAIFSSSCFLFFGTVQDRLNAWQKFSFLANTVVLLIIILSLLSIIFLRFKKNKKEPVILNRYFFYTFLFLLGYEIVRFFFFIISDNNYPSFTYKKIEPIIEKSGFAPVAAPDIYYLVFDSYTNSIALKNYWGYENDIKNYLEKKGFFVADSSFSNYNFTPFSISSIFNLQYVNNADLFLERNAQNFFIGNRLYAQSILFQTLQKSGYKISAFSILENINELERLGPFAPDKPTHWVRKQTMERIYLNPWLFNKLYSLLTKRKRTPPAIRKSLENIIDYNQKAEDNIRTQYRYLSNTPSADPHFIYSHFTIPHGPYIFDKLGKPEPEASFEKEEMNGYLEQVRYANLKIRQLIDLLASDTIRKKIIIIQGDHGFRNYPAGIPLKAEYDALNAIFFYNGDYSGFQKTTSLVNTYRLVLNKILHINLPILKDSIAFKN